jgi:flagellar motor switch protein FliN/FliY
MTTEEALVKLGESTAHAVAKALETVCGGAVETGPVTVLAKGANPLESVALPAVVTNVSYVNGVTGGNVFVITRMGARRLAAAMMGEDATAVGDGELSELELSAAGEAANQTMAAAAAATSSVLRQEIEIGPPATTFADSAGDLPTNYEATPHATAVTFRAFGEVFRLIQLVPNAFVVRMARAFDELEAELAGGRIKAGADGAFSSESAREITVRVWGELGRTRMPVGQAVGLPAGSVVELDRASDEPIDLYVNGRRFATGRLLLVDGDWAVRVESLLPVPESDLDSP